MIIINYIVFDFLFLVIFFEYIVEFLVVFFFKIWLVLGIEIIIFIDEVVLKCVNINICIYDEIELYVFNIS